MKSRLFLDHDAAGSRRLKHQQIGTLSLTQPYGLAVHLFTSVPSSPRSSSHSSFASAGVACLVDGGLHEACTSIHVILTTTVSPSLLLHLDIVCACVQCCTSDIA